MTDLPTPSAGVIPPGVPRFNWGAFFFPPLWPLVYGLPGWSFVAFATEGLLAFMSRGLTTESPTSSLVVVIGVQEAVLLAVRLYFALNLTQAYWQRYPDRLTPDEFVRRQPKWILIGAFIMIVWLVLNVLALTAS